MKRISEASNHVLFLSPQGRVFQNKASVTMFLNGGQVDEEVLGETKEVKMKGMEVKEEDWLEDASLPTGWSLRMTSDKSKLIRAPGGKMYTTRLDAIKSLLELDANKEEVALMKEGLKEDGWEVVEYLPPGWMLRKVKRKMKNEYKTEYMTPQLTILKSIRDLILSMKEFGVDEEARMRALSHKWKPDVDLPPGILTNKVYNKNVGHNTFDSYLTIDGLFFQSVYHLLRHLHTADPAGEEVVKRAEMMGEVFTERYNQTGEARPANQPSFASMRLVKGQVLYYRVLENLLAEEQRRGKSIGQLVQQAIFHQSLFAACLEVVIFSHYSQKVTI